MLDIQQKKDHERMWKDVYIPPPLEILSRKYTNKEPVRTGFNQGLLPNKIQHNIEIKRAPQGPYISVTNNVLLRKKERDISSRERLSRQGSRGAQRASSRESSVSSMSRMDYREKQSAKGETEKKDGMVSETEVDGEQQKVQ